MTQASAATPRTFKPGDSVHYMKASGGRNTINLNTKYGVVQRVVGDLVKIKPQHGASVWVEIENVRHQGEKTVVGEVLFGDKQPTTKHA